MRKIVFCLSLFCIFTEADTRIIPQMLPEDNYVTSIRYSEEDYSIYSEILDRTDNSESPFHHVQIDSSIDYSIDTNDSFRDILNFSDLIETIVYDGPAPRINVKIKSEYVDLNGDRWIAHGSGILIDPMHVLTVGHNLFHHQENASDPLDDVWADEVEIIPVYNDGNRTGRPYYAANGVDWLIWDAFVQDEDLHHDIAVITLDRPIGALTGYSSIAFETDEYLDNVEIGEFSYPAESPYNGDVMYYRSGTYGNTTEFYLRYWSRSYEGQSGAGECEYSDNGFTTYGVLSNGGQWYNGELLSWTNCVRITESKYNTITGWIDNNTPNHFDIIPLTMNINGNIGSVGDISIGETLEGVSFSLHNYSSEIFNDDLHYEIRMSEDSNFDDSDISLYSGVISTEIEPKGTVEVSLNNTVQIPASIIMESGFIYVSLIVEDHNTDNNTMHDTDARATFVLNCAPPALTLGSVTPSSGTTSDNYHFSISYASQANEEPTVVNLIVDGSTPQPMEPSGENWSIGVDYSLSITDFNIGDHSYYFEAILPYSDNLRYPQTGSQSFSVNQSSEGWEVSASASYTSSELYDPGDDIGIDLTAWNQGDYSYSDLTTRVTLVGPDGQQLDDSIIEISSLDPANQFTAEHMVSIPTTASEGTYVIDCQVIPTLDSDWSNNVYTLSFYIGEYFSSDQYVVEQDQLFLNAGDNFTIAGITYNLMIANANEGQIVVQEPSGDDETISVDQIELFDYGASEQFIICDGVYDLSPDPTEAQLHLGYAIQSGGPQFQNVSINGFRGDEVRFQAQSASYPFENNSSNHECFTDVPGGDNYMDDWYNSISPVQGYNDVEFVFNIPNNAGYGNHPFYFWTEFENSNDGIHVTRLAINVLHEQPEISEVSQLSISADDPINISGSHFFSNGTVEIGSLTCPVDNILTWSGSSIDLIVPVGVEDGIIRVITDYGSSNGIPYSVLSNSGEPVVSSPIPDQVLVAGDTLTVAVLSNHFSDPNNDELTFSISIQDTLLTYISEDFASGVLRVTYPDNYEGMTTAEVIATDPLDKSVSDLFSVTISDINDPPTVHTPPDRIIDEDGSLVITLVELDSLVSDPDNSFQELEISFGSYDSCTYLVAEDQFTLTPPPDWFGIMYPSIIVNDGQYTISQSFQFTVLPINDPPFVLESFNDTLSFELSGVDTISFDDVVGDIDNLVSDLTLEFAGSELVTVNVIDSLQVCVFIADEEDTGFTGLEFTVADDSSQTTANLTVHVYDPLSIRTDRNTIPTDYYLSQNYPNPFNPSTTIRYGMPESADVALVIYDVRGQVVHTLESGHQPAGWYDVVWNGEIADGKQISTGIYFARLVAGDHSEVIKMLYLK